MADKQKERAAPSPLEVLSFFDTLANRPTPGCEDLATELIMDEVFSYFGGPDRVPLSTASILNVVNILRSLQATQGEIQQTLEPILQVFQARLLEFEGREFNSFVLNRLVAANIQDIASRLRKAFRCPKPACGVPAKLRCIQPIRTPTGVFQFEHVVKGKRTNHGGYTALPRLELIDPAPDRRKKR